MGKLATALKLAFDGDLKQIRRRFRANVQSWKLRRRTGVPFVYRLHGIPLVCFPGNAESEQPFLSGECDRLELEALRRWLQPGDGFVDVGANLGLYSFAAAHFLGGEGIVVAVEPSRELVELMRKAADLLGAANLEFVECAAGDAAREVVFNVAAPGRPTGEQSLYVNPDRAADYVPRTIRMRTLADITAEFHEIAQTAAVKIDVEGAEPLALSAAPSTWFTNAGPLWIVEINPLALARAGFSPSAVTGLFPADRFDRWLIPHYGKTGDRNLPNRPVAQGEAFADAWFYNLVAIPRRSADSKRRARLVSMFPHLRRLA